MESLLADHPDTAPVDAVRRAPDPAHGGPLALLAFMHRNRMLRLSYIRLIARWLMLKLRFGSRLRTDGLCFICPGVKLEIGPHATLSIGRWAWIGHGSKIRVHEGEVSIGAKTVMGQECTISAYQKVSIGRECILADRVMLIDFDHGVVEVERPIRAAGHLQARRAGRRQRVDGLRRLRAAWRDRRREQRRGDQLGGDQGGAGERRRGGRARTTDQDARRAAR